MDEYINPYPQSIEFDEETRILTVKVKLAEKGRVSSTGKSTIMFATPGFIKVQVEDYRMNMTVIKPIKKEDKT